MNAEIVRFCLLEFAVAGYLYQGIIIFHHHFARNSSVDLWQFWEVQTGARSPRKNIFKTESTEANTHPAESLLLNRWDEDDAAGKG